MENKLIDKHNICECSFTKKEVSDDNINWYDITKDIDEINAKISDDCERLYSKSKRHSIVYHINFKTGEIKKYK